MIGEPESFRSSAPRLSSVPRVGVLIGCMWFSYTRAFCWSHAVEPLDRTQHTLEITIVNPSFRSGWGVSCQACIHWASPVWGGLWLWYLVPFFWTSHRPRGRASVPVLWINWGSCKLWMCACTQVCLPGFPADVRRKQIRYCDIPRVIDKKYFSPVV